MNTVIVFGATGNLGAYIAIDLKDHGYQVVATGHRKSDNGFFASHGIEYVSLDINDKESFAKLPQENVYAVAHFAGELPSRYNYQPDKLLSSIVLGTLNVLDYMVKVGAKKIVFPQTPFDLYKYHNTEIAIEADMPRVFPLTGDHSIYTIAKNAAVDLIEHYAATYGISWFVLRFFTIYEYHPNPYHFNHYKHQKMPFRILMDKAMHSEPIEIWGDPNRRKEIVYIKDFTQCVRKAIECDVAGGIYNVGGKETVSLDEQIRGIVEVFSPKDNPSVITYRPDMPNALEAHFDMSKTKKELGYEPKYSYIEAMQDFYHEMKTEPFAQLWGKGKIMKYKDNEIMVSVVCDVYNHEPYLRQCLDGFVMQKTNFKFEVLVHDDASTDKSAEIIMEYTNKYPDLFKPIIQKENQYSKGVGIWKTYQFPRVKGKYIAFCEGDDYWIDSLKLQKQVDVLESDKSCTMVYCGFSTVDEKGTQVSRYDFDFNMKHSESGFIFPVLIFRNLIMTVSCMVRNDVLSSDVYINCSENLDYNLFLAASILGKCIFLKDKECAYRKVSSSMTNSNCVYVQKRFLKVWEYYINFFIQNISTFTSIQIKNTKISILAKAIDLWLKGFGSGYLKSFLKNKDFCYYLIPACLYEFRYLFKYNLKKVFKYE